MSCVNLDVCPSASGWCKLSGAAPSEKCVEFLISAWEAEKKAREKAEKEKVLFFCDKRACESCGGYCTRTSDVRHAKNFELFGDRFVEIGPKDRSEGESNGVSS